MTSLYGPPQREPPALRAVPDLSALPVHDAVGQRVGQIFASLSEAANGLIRYLDVDLGESQRHVLVPIGHARLEERHGHLRVRLLAATREELQEIPSYPPGRDPSDQYQRDLLCAYSRLFYGERYYAHPSYDHSGLYAGEHTVIHGDEAGASPAGADRARERMRHLRDLRGYDLPPGRPDIRGWPLQSGDDMESGTVSDLVIDTVQREFRYITLQRGSATKVLPVGFLSVDHDARRVRAPALADAEIGRLPDYRGPPMTREFEDALRAGLDACCSAERRYHRPDFRRPTRECRDSP